MIIGEAVLTSVDDAKTGVMHGPQDVFPSDGRSVYFARVMVRTLLWLAGATGWGAAWFRIGWLFGRGVREPLPPGGGDEP